MPTPRALTCLAVAAVAATTALTATSGAASAATGAATTDTTPGYSVTPITVAVKVGPANDQACSVDADLYLPDGASAAHPVPAILTTNGFGGSKDDDNQAAIGKGFAGQGYAVLSYSGLGFGKTTCKVELDDPDYDGKAGKQMDDVLAGVRPYVDQSTGTSQYLRSIAMESKGDPRVGMIGGSYGGQIQYAVASQDPRIDTIVPIITWNDLSYSLAPGMVAKKEWVDLFFGDGIISGAENASADPTTLAGCPNFTDQACVGIAAMNTVGYPDAGTIALAKHASVSSYVNKIKVPTLLVQGEQDTLFNLNEASDTYAALKKQGTPVKMVWQSWGHSHSDPAPGELDFGAASLRDSYLGRRFLDWMNHYVRGTSSASTGPEFSYFRDWVPYDTDASKAGTDVAKAYATSSTVAVGKPKTLYLTGSDALTASKAAVVAGSASYANAGPAPTSYSETSGLEGSTVNNAPSDAPGTFAAFTSPVLKSPAEVVGSPCVTLHLTAPLAAQTQAAGPSGQLVLFAKVYDVAPDGTKVLKNRLISPLRVSDVNKTVTVRLPGIVHRFATGHRIQVAIAASDAAYANNTAPEPVTITTSPIAPSSLSLPLTSALTF
jgi:putative CocE/NonD family hydrolase